MRLWRYSISTIPSLWKKLTWHFWDSTNWNINSVRPPAKQRTGCSIAGAMSFVYTEALSELKVTHVWINIVKWIYRPRVVIFCASSFFTSAELTWVSQVLLTVKAGARVVLTWHFYACYIRQCIYMCLHLLRENCVAYVTGFATVFVFLYKRWLKISWPNVGNEFSRSCYVHVKFTFFEWLCRKFEILG